MSNNQMIPEFTVELYVYDLSHGMARMLSQSFLGKQIDAIYHTGVVIYGYEYYFGGGIVYSRPGQSSAGHPIQKLLVGHTTKTQQQFHDYLISQSYRFTQSTYSLLRHNCNNFSDEMTMWLCNKHIPSHILNLPQDAFSTPQGMAFKPMVEQMEAGIRQSGAAGAGINLPWSQSALLLPPIDTQLLAVGNRQRTQSEIDAELRRAEHLPTPTPALAMNASGTATMQIPDHIMTAQELNNLITEEAGKPLLAIETKQVNSFFTLIKMNNKKVSDRVLTDDELQKLHSLVEKLSSRSAKLEDGKIIFDELITKWPESHLFAVLALFRIFVLSEEVSQHYAQIAKNMNNAPENVMSRLVKLSNDSSVPHAAASMALSSLAHLLSSTPFNDKSHNMLIFECINISVSRLSDPQQSVRLMAATLLYNVIVTFPNIDDASDDEQSNTFISMIEQLCTSASKESDAQVIERLLFAIGHLIRRNAICALLLDSQIDWQSVSQLIDSKAGGNTQIKSLIAEITQIIKETAA